MFLRKLTPVLILLTFLTTAVHSQIDKLPPIPAKTYQLKNGLTVVLNEDHSTPIVAISLWYKVGSKNEVRGRTGFAHLFEHLMFQGSGNYSSGYIPVVREFASSVNGTTNKDRTFYFEVVPSNFLERALYLEADRMGNLLGAVDQAKLDNQRDVVKNERRSRNDNVPYGTFWERLDKIVYPEGHPYHHPTIGSMDDLSAASLDDIKAFFRKYYLPNNTVMSLSGDFNDKQARAWIQKYFGPIKAGTPVTMSPPPQPQISGIVRQQYEDLFAPTPRINLTWATSPEFSPDEAPLALLGDILTSGRASRLQKILLYDKELVGDVSAGNGTWQLGGTFGITATARAGKSLDEIEREINKEIERVKRDGVSAAELSRAITGYESSSIFDIQWVEDKGSYLAYYMATLGKPNDFQGQLDRYRKVTLDDIKRVANKYLNANHVVFTAVPSTTAAKPGRTDAPTSLQSKKVDPELMARQIAMLPKAGPDPTVNLPAINKMKLSNGLNVWVVEQHELPIVAMNMVINAGSSYEDTRKSGLAAFTSSMLSLGTRRRSAEELAAGIQSIGASAGLTQTRHFANVTFQTLSKKLDEALDYYADGLTNPAFPDGELRSLKGRTLNSLRQQKANANSLSTVIFDKVLYGDQVYGRQTSGTEQTISGISREDIVRFHNDNYRPNNATLIVVGDVRPTDLKVRLEKAFANWKPGELKQPVFPEQQMAAQPAIYLVDKPGAVQSNIAIGQVVTDRKNPDYYALLLMNSVLGAAPSGRLRMNLREDKGYTYGASSQMGFRIGRGPFIAQSAVQMISTKESVQEFMKEINGIRGERPVTAAELELHKQAIIRGFPAVFETNDGIANQLLGLVTFGLPDNYIRDYISEINKVTLDDVNRVAKQYLEPSKMAIVIIGDRSVISPKLKELGMPIIDLDTDGNRIIP